MNDDILLLASMTMKKMHREKKKIQIHVHIYKNHSLSISISVETWKYLHNIHTTHAEEWTHHEWEQNSSETVAFAIYLTSAFCCCSGVRKFTCFVILIAVRIRSTNERLFHLYIYTLYKVWNYFVDKTVTETWQASHRLTNVHSSHILPRWKCVVLIGAANVLTVCLCDTDNSTNIPLSRTKLKIKYKTNTSTSNVCETETNEHEYGRWALSMGKSTNVIKWWVKTNTLIHLNCSILTVLIIITE